MSKQSKFTIAAIGDIHVEVQSTGHFKEMFSRINDQADILLLCGDLTNTGLAEEAHVLAQELAVCRVPVLMVLGNHDYDKNQNEEIKHILTTEYTHVLDGDFFVHHDVGFAGVKGFPGGFDSHMVASFGEPELKDFVKFSVEESLKLENALNRLETEKKVVLTHYSPLATTVVGEPPEIFPFLGSSRLEEPLDHFNVSVAFHGHAHKGTYEGKSKTGVSVYNVSMPIMRERNPEQPYALINI